MATKDDIAKLVNTIYAHDEAKAQAIRVKEANAKKSAEEVVSFIKKTINELGIEDLFPEEIPDEPEYCRYVVVSAKLGKRSIPGASWTISLLPDANQQGIPEQVIIDAIANGLKRIAYPPASESTPR